ncbi:hypothetical protein V6O07_12960, partial [Arthrospira platensis SPKY2]
PREWALFSTLSTNKPVSSKLVTAGDETDAQLARLLELRVDPSPVFSKGSDAGRKLHRLFTQNYGWAGRAFIERCVAVGEQGLRAIINHAFDEFPKKYHRTFTGVERFWEAVLVMVDLALKLAREWDIISYNEVEVLDWALAQLSDMRETVAEYRNDMFDLLAQYVNEHLDHTLLVYHEPGREPYPNLDRMPRGPIRIRIDGRRTLGVTKLVGGTMLLERSH